MANPKMDDRHQSQKILQAAFTCIASRGYANVSLRDIADEAGVVLSQLNYYYKNKEGLFREVVKTLARQYFTEIEEKLKNVESKKEKIASLVKYFQEMLKHKPEHLALLFDLSSMALWSESLRELLDDLFNNLTALIEKHIFPPNTPEKESPGARATALSRLMLGAITGTSIQVMLGGRREEAIDSLANIPALFE